MGAARRQLARADELTAIDQKGPRMKFPSAGEPAYRNPTTAFDRDGRLLLRWCAHCSSIYPSWIDFCTTDYSHELGWTPAQGVGTLFSWVTYRKQYELPRALPVPYTVGLVELPEGPRVAGIVHADGTDLSRGTFLRLEVDRVDGQVYPAWSPA
jgi:uncharacterized protein